MEEDFKLLAYYYYSLFEGDTYLIEDAFLMLRKYGIIDEDNEYIYEEDVSDDLP